MRNWIKWLLSSLADMFQNSETWARARASEINVTSSSVPELSPKGKVSGIFDHGKVDLDTLVGTLWGEARGESIEGLVAVAWVVRNRARIARLRGGHPLFGNGTIVDACLRPWQFSCWMDQQKEDCQRIARGHYTPREQRLYNKCLKAASDVLDGRVSDPTDGSTHYHAEYIPFPKAWGEKKEPVVKIGAHLFYNNVK